jgi:hypothetical protein
VVTTVADTSELRCLDHGDVLVPHEGNLRSADQSLMCPAEPDSIMSTRNRRCIRCGARDASWMSGLCDTHAKAYYRSLAQQERDAQDASAIRRGLNETIDAAVGAGADDVAAWLRVYLADQP